MSTDLKRAVKEASDRILAHPAKTDEQLAAEEQERRREEFSRRVDECWRAWASVVGERYHKCDVDNFEATGELAKSAKQSVSDYCRAIRANVKAGAGVLLFGPKGTGKDHLLSAASRHAIAHGIRVLWQNGADLFGDVRDAIGRDQGERDVLARFIHTPVFYLSDPLPPAGKLTEFQAATLFRILDGRYRAKRPTWVSVNATGRADLEERLGAQNADRLRDGALAIYCNWASYRKPAST